MTLPASPTPTFIPPVPTTGREGELDELSDALTRALGGKPTIVTVLAADGMGKTRLLDEFANRLQAKSPNVRLLRTAARSKGTGVEIVAKLLRQRLGIPETASSELTAAALESTVREVLGDEGLAEFLYVLGSYLGVASRESAVLKLMEEDPAHFAGVQRAVLRRFLEADAAAHPVVLIFEDLHFASDDMLRLLRTVLASLRGVPLLAVLTARPELSSRAPEVLELATHVRIDLGPLRDDDARRYVERLLSPLGEPPEELVHAAVRTAGGSPYLLEQLVQTYVSAGVIVADGENEDGTSRWRVELAGLGAVELPVTIEAAVAARIAALAPGERTLLRSAAIMGSTFWLGALVSLGRAEQKVPALWGGAEDLAAQHRDLLAQLVARDVLYAITESAIPGDEEYGFRHDLERNALYESMSTADVARQHLRVAQWMDCRFEARSEEQIELLAYHYERAGHAKRAATFYLASGSRARERFANDKACDAFAHAFRLLGPEDDAPKLDALHDFGDVLQLVGRNEEAIAAFEEMRALAYRLDLKAKGGVAHNRIGRVYRAIGHLEEAMRHLGTGHALFHAADDARGVASSLDDVGKVHWMRGNYEAAESFMQKGLELRREHGDLRSIGLSLNNLGLVYSDSGRFSEALTAFNEALARRREIGDRNGIAQTLNNLGSMHQDNDDHGHAAVYYREALEHARVVGDRMRLAAIMTNLGETMYRLGDPNGAIAVLREAEEISTALGDRILEGEILRGLAKAHMLVKDFVVARDLIGKSVALFEQAKGKPFLGVALRTAGEISGAAHVAGAGQAETRGYFERAVSIFEELGNQLELARACTAYANYLSNLEDAATHRFDIERLRGRASEVQGRLSTSSSELLAPLHSDLDDPTLDGFRDGNPTSGHRADAGDDVPSSDTYSGPTPSDAEPLPGETTEPGAQRPEGL